MKRSINRGIRVIARTSVAVAVLVAAAASNAAADDLCGATLVAGLTLEHDLSCAGDGLIVGADGITVDLNGHTITGAGVGAGVSAAGRTGVLITGGTIRNFLVGVQLSGSTGITVKHIGVTGNRDGIFLIGSSGNTAGILFNIGATGLLPSANRLVENMITTNACGLAGSTTGNTLKENLFQGNVVDMCP